jgi:hypothetical protein
VTASKRIARLLFDLDDASDDHELVARFDHARDELVSDGEAFLAFLTQAQASGRIERVNAARDRYVAGLVQAIELDHERRRNAILPNAFETVMGAAKGASTDADDPLHFAEQQMGEHEFDLFREMFEDFWRRLDVEGRDDPATEAEVSETLAQWLAENPDARGLIERLVVFRQSRGASEEEKD